MMTQHCKPFDLEAFRDGAPHATKGGEPVKYVCYASEEDFPEVSNDMRLLVLHSSDKVIYHHTPGGNFWWNNESGNDLVQVPFCIHDGTPLFYGDKLWSPRWGDVVVKKLVGFNCVDVDGHSVPLHELQWEKPVPKRRVKAFDMPTPVTTQQCCGTAYWTFYMEGTFVSACSRIWDDRETDYTLLYAGLIYPDKASAIAAGSAVLLAITTKKD